MDLLGLYYNYSETTVTNPITDNETTTTSHSYGLMADMDAQPLLGHTTTNVGSTDLMTGLTGHLSLIRIGFNYSF